MWECTEAAAINSWCNHPQHPPTHTVVYTVHTHHLVLYLITSSSFFLSTPTPTRSVISSLPCRLGHCQVGPTQKHELYSRLAVAPELLHLPVCMHDHVLFWACGLHWRWWPMAHAVVEELDYWLDYCCELSTWLQLSIYISFKKTPMVVTVNLSHITLWTSKYIT